MKSVVFPFRRAFSTITDPYKVLGVSPSASEKEIKDAYKKLCLKHHPDKNPGNQQESEKKFKEVAEAYRMVTEGGYRPGGGSRSTGESTQNGGFTRSPFPGFASGGPFSHFEDLFRGGHAFSGGNGFPGGATTVKEEIIMKDGKPWKKKITKTSKTQKGTRTEIIEEEI